MDKHTKQLKQLIFCLVMLDVSTSKSPKHIISMLSGLKVPKKLKTFKEVFTPPPKAKWTPLRHLDCPRTVLGLFLDECPAKLASSV